MLVNSKCDKNQNSKWDKTGKITKLKNSKCAKTRNVTKLEM